MKHTKGPWTKEFGAFTPGYASTMRIVSEDNTHAVCDVFWGNEHSSFNANLIAAAPELLEALATIYNLANLQTLLETKYSKALVSDLMKQMQVALDKAKGTKS